ncbi:outer membrane protein assembly factor BamA [Aliarcobacter skirrowii CCUG 10374]|uniref:Outer membrane protein assembly factor BamA n=1 Tax=Aliarcobacter skirrowii CCUG 10374 TaxID=1032239 RepID=A0ABY0EGU4_9BACT|nr:outer membrane protein assembly factor BamA [Aliarcobacter skirrowii CCUG 10374]RXI25619.1 outer membrane protein assembly factor BamA [Aliarcobacter skirrowii CCUG 10374]
MFLKRYLFLFGLSLGFIEAEVVKSIEYEGVSRLSQQSLNETVDIKAGDKLDEKKLNIALKKLFSFDYFDDIYIEDKNGDIKFVFKEKPSIAKVDIKGYKTRSEEKDAIIKLIKLNKGSMYSEKKIDEAKKTLLSILESEGFINSVVEVDIEKLNEESLSIIINVNKGDEIIIKDANYYGAKQLTQEEFNTVTANKEKQWASWWFGRSSGELKIDQLKYDSRRMNDLYFERGFLDAIVQEPYMSIDFASNQANMNFFITEGEPYTTSDIKIFIDSTIVDPEDLYKNLRLKKEKIFNIAQLRRDQEYIRTKVADKGYAYAEVLFDLKKDEITHRVDVIFNVIPGKKVYINDVKISGNTRTLDRVIRRNVLLAPTELYSLTDINDSKNRLRRTGFFEDVILEEKRVSEDKMDLIVKVVEAPTGSLMLGGGYGSYDKFMINGSISDSNIFGSGLRLALSADLSSRSSVYDLSLSNPSINDSDYNGQISIYRKDYEIRKSRYDEDLKSTGLSLGLGKEVVRNTYVGATYSLDFIKESYTNYDSSVPEDKRFQDADYINSSITPYINFDNTNDYYFPTQGFRANASVEYAGVGGDSKYVKPSTIIRYYYSLEDLTELDWVIRLKTQARVLIDNGQINQGDSLYLGGPRTLRGYKSYAFPKNDDGYRQDPYTKMWANSAEISFPLIKSAKMRWGAFYDYGMIGKDSFSEIKRAGTGILLEWISPMGPLQLIFSKPLMKEEGDDTSSFEFSFGATF